jgi:hypothetical protein
MFEVPFTGDNVIDPMADGPTPEIFIDFPGRQNNARVFGS